MDRSSFYALLAAVFVLTFGLSSKVYAQARGESPASHEVKAAATIVDGISLGIRKSHQDETELWIEANDLKATVLIRSEGKLFREYKLTDERALERQEIAVAFE